MLTSLEASIFDTIAGLPLHPLVVHFAVVLLPLSGLLVLLGAVLRRWRGVLAMFALLGALLGTGAAFVAKESGEALAERLGDEPVQHAQLGDILPWAAVVYLVLVALWWLFARRAAVPARAAGSTRAGAVTPDGRPVATPDGRASRGPSGILGLLASLAALVVLVLTTMVGHTGAQAAWGDFVEDPAPLPAPTSTPS